MPWETTCAALSHSNVEVIVVSFCPIDELLPGDGGYLRKMTTHCWFGIGPTISKYKEADTAFHYTLLTFTERRSIAWVCVPFGSHPPSTKYPSLQ